MNDVMRHNYKNNPITNNKMVSGISSLALLMLNVPPAGYSFFKGAL